MCWFWIPTTESRGVGGWSVGKERESKLNIKISGLLDIEAKECYSLETDTEMKYMPVSFINC